MVDVIPALISFLKADAAVAALVGTRVFGAEVPAGETASQPRKAIILRQGGGTSEDSYLPLGIPRIDLHAHGETPYEARRVRRAAHTALKALQREVITGVTDGDVLLHHLNASGGPVDLRFPETDWPVVIESWDVMFAETAVT